MTRRYRYAVLPAVVIAAAAPAAGIWRQDLSRQALSE